MQGLTPLEQAVLDKLLAGTHPVLDALRTQAAQATVRSRENTGVGFFTYFQVSPNVARLSQSKLHLSDVSASVGGLEHGAGFVLFVRDGYLDNLEGFTYDEPWPEKIERFQVSYNSDPRQLTLDTSRT